jgi:NADH-quinone oxidoreductase subunit K
MTTGIGTVSFVLVGGALALFWVGMLGLLWRRSLMGMLLGLLFAWISVAVGAIGFAVLRADPEDMGEAGALVLCVAVLCFMQIATGLAIVVSRIRRRGTLDVEDAGLLEG